MNALLPNGRIRLLAILWLILLFISIGLIVFFIGTSPANASIVNVFASPTATQENLWAYADIPKPIHTAAPTILPADTPLPVPTETPGSMVMDFVEDTPAPMQSAQEQVNPPGPSYGGS